MAHRRRSPRFEQLEHRHLLTAGPTLSPLSNVTLLSGAPLQVPINATSPSGFSLTYSVTSTNSAITADLQNGNPDLVLNITHTSSGQAGDSSFSGTLVIELFPNAAPNTVAQIESLAQAGTYNGTDFYRIVPGFVAQAGLDGASPPAGTTVNTLDDEFNPVLPLANPSQPLRYSSAGVVGLARQTADDTGSSEFFITTTATSSFLDYEYTVFGQVVSGANLLTEIGNVPNNASNNNLPDSPVTITSATISTDNNDFALGLSAPLNTTTTGSVTVTANDGHGGTTSQTFQVSVQPDTNDPPPVFKAITTPTMSVNQATSFTLPAFDLEGDALTFTNLSSTIPGLTVSVNSSTGLVTLTPTSGLQVGVQSLSFGVASAVNSTPDTQTIPLFIDPASPTGVSLEAASDTGSSNSDDITSLNNSNANNALQFLVTGVTPGDVVFVRDGSTDIGSSLAVSSSVVVTTDSSTLLADGSHQITAVQSLENQDYTAGNTSGTTSLTSSASTALPLTVDAAGPTFSSSPNLTATVESPYSYTAQATDSVSTGLVYAVVSGPSGFSINPSSGVVTWTPSLAESGSNPVEISVTDKAGNTKDQSFSVVTSFAPLAVASITPADGSANIAVNSAILVQFNDPMNSATLNSSTLLLKDSQGNTIAATYSYDSTTAIATITPTAPLANSTTYTLTVVSGADGVANSDGGTLSNDVTASFTTEAPLSVTSITPANGSTAVGINTTIAVTFDNAMNAATLKSTTLVLKDSQNNVVATTVTYNSATDTATITPNSLLSNSTTYTLTVTSGVDGVGDTGGETLANDSTASFTTAAPLTVVSVTPADDATGATVTSVVVKFSGGLNSTTVNSGTLKLEDSAGNITSATVTYDSATDTATITPTAPLAPGATYLVYIVGGASGIADSGADTMVDNFTSSFTTAIGAPVPTPGPGQTTLFSNSTVPPYSDNPDSQAVELGVQFQSNESGYIVGIRFYKGASSSGTNIGNLWSANGTLLAQATFTNETASGWQEVNFSQPVAIQAGTKYIAAYFAPSGNYADDLTFFANGSLTNGPLTASGSFYLYGTNAFPTQTFETSNYYVDPVFSQLVGAVTPTAGATSVATSSAITIPFLAGMNSATISSTTLQLKDSSNDIVPATVTYDSGTNTATLTPSDNLNAGATYTVVITGGAEGVADSNGNTLSANVTWTFTTAPSSPAVLSILPSTSSTGIDSQSPIQITFNEAMNASTLTGENVFLQNASGDTLAATVSYNSNNHVATLTPEAPLNSSANYTVVVDGGEDGVADPAGNTMAATFTSTFTTAATLGTGPFSLWTNSTTPAWTDNPDPRSVELGVQFESTGGGNISGIRFYQSAANTGPQIVNLWSSAGTLLATATSSSTTGPGWVEINFAQPVHIEANTVYVASYFTADGKYADNEGFFNSSSFTNGPLTALAGVYNYGSQSAFPTEVFDGSNYWVDVVLAPPATQNSADVTTNAIIAAAVPVIAAPTASPLVATPAVTVAPTVEVAPSSNSATQILNVAGALPLSISNVSAVNIASTTSIATALIQATAPASAASSAVVQTNSTQSIIASPGQSTAAAQFGGGLLSSDIDTDGGDSTPTIDPAAQSPQPQASAVTSDLELASAATAPTDYWLAAFDGLDSQESPTDAVSPISPAAIDAFFSAADYQSNFPA